MTIAEPETLERLISRLRALRPETERRWGTLSAGEMLCHLGDAHDVVLKRDADASGIRKRPFLKWLAIYGPVLWSRGWQTDASVDPKRDGTRPGEFEADRERVVDGMRKIATAADGELNPAHGLLGPLTTSEWQRSVYRHVNHHLKQFGV